MNTNREERLQMRQRGAATRKTKAIDFGFSFGLAPSAAEPPSQTASQPSEIGIIPETAAPPQPTSVPEATEQPQLSPVRTPSASQNQGSSQRTPGSARNSLPERPSMFDIPSDGEIELGRSSKRRKIESPSKFAAATTSTTLDTTAQETSSSEPQQNGTTPSAPAPPSNEPGDVPLATTTEVSQGTLGSDAALVSGRDGDETRQAGENAGVNGTEEEATVTQDNLQKQTGGVSPPTNVTNGERNGQDSEAPGPPSPEIVAVSEQLEHVVLEPAVPEQAVPEQAVLESVAPKLPMPDQVDEVTWQPTRSPDVQSGHRDSTKEAGEPQTQRQKRPRGRPRAATRTQPSTSEEIGKEELGSAEKAPVPPVSGNENKRPRKRTRGTRSTSEDPTENGAPNGMLHHEQQIQTNGNDVANKDKEVEPSVPQESIQKKKGKRARRAGKVRLEKTEQDEPGPSNGDAEEDVQAQLEKEQEPEPQPEAENEVEPRPANADETEPPTQPEPSSRPKKRRGRPSLASKRDDSKPTESEERQEAQSEAEEETSQPARKRARQPRGETVPVTVHRLVNVALLGEPSRPDSPADDEESTDELATRRKTKLPSRGGVNPADVLSQICRETLEKTLTTLKNGIANESNPARRAEWTRKKKAVEAFEAELEGRLFELSEMLDSNFVLGVQLKKAKREMMDLRGRLHQVRKEREAVALRIDAVRRKHAEEEDARMGRISISNSLHSLELAVERGHNRSSVDNAGEEDAADASPASGLEFMLRSVAENVSSTAPGAQGGLLDQIKSFNAQLEDTARRLES